MRVVSGGYRSGGFSRFVALILILLAIVLVASWFAVRSEGGRNLIESQLSKRLGLPISVEATRIGWPYVLVLENLRTLDFAAAGTPGFSAAEVRVGCAVRTWRPSYTLRLRQVIARIQEDQDGCVTPLCLAPLADLTRASLQDVVRMTSKLRDQHAKIYVRDSSLGWLDASGVEIAAIRDVDFRMIPVRIEARQIHYFLLNIKRASGVRLAEGRDLQWEWLTTQEFAYIELSSHVDQDGAHDPDDDAVSPDILESDGKAPLTKCLRGEGAPAPFFTAGRGCSGFICFDSMRF